MKIYRILTLTFLPLTLLAQDLKCCESVKEIETYLSGYWKKKDSELNRQYRYEFNDGVGSFVIFETSENGDLVEVENNLLVINILKTSKGFEIEHVFDIVKTYTVIKHLDSNKLIVTRKDGAETEYYKIIE